MFTFKRVDCTEDVNKIYKEGFVSQAISSAGINVRDAIKSIHNDNASKFINVSKDFMDLTIKNIDGIRDSIAVILGFDKSNVKVTARYYTYHSVGELIRLPIFAMENLVLDCSSEESVSLLEKKGLVNNKDTIFVSNNEGIYVYDHILPKYIKTILGSLEIDMLYSLLKEYGVADNNILGFIDFVLPNVVRSNAKYKLTKSEKILFDAMFIQNKSLITILKEIIEQNAINASILIDDSEDNDMDYVVINDDVNVNALNILAYLKNKKRVILNKVFNKTGFTVSKVVIPEDTIKVFSIGNVEHDNNVMLSYNGVQLVIPFQEYDNYMMVGNTDENDKNQEYLNDAYEQENLKTKKLNKTPKI